MSRRTAVKQSKKNEEKHKKDSRKSDTLVGKEGTPCGLIGISKRGNQRKRNQTE